MSERLRALAETILAEVLFLLAAWYLQPANGYGWQSKVIMMVLALAGIAIHGRPRDYGLLPPDPRRSLRWSLYILVLFAGASSLGTAIYLIRGGAIDPVRIVENLVWYYVFVGLSEELFFRGYVQSRLNEVFTRKYRSFIGVRVEWTQGTLITGIFLFGLPHLLTGVNPFRGIYGLDLPVLAITASAMFMGLVLGIIRERLGCVYIPAILHGSMTFTTFGLGIPPSYSGAISGAALLVFFTFMFERMVGEGWKGRRERE